MKYLSVCSGIEACSVAWAGTALEPLAFSEIDAFPSAVLRHHYPGVPNLGDMTKFQEWPDFPELDLLVGGTPCQSFSISGMRKGLKDPRGNLTLTFLAIAERYRPKFILWENVPGILSESTGALNAFLDGLEEIGYICDIDILDAQFFGLAQRRRRIFILCQDRNHLVQSTTLSSALTIVQCLAEILHGGLISHGLRCVAEPESWASDEKRLSLGAMARMKLFAMLEPGGLERLQRNLEEGPAKFPEERKSSDLMSGEDGPDTRTPRAGKSGSTSEEVAKSIASWNTGPSWKMILGETLRAGKSCITLIATRETTSLKIYSCAMALLNIADCIAKLNPSCPPSYSAASSVLTGLIDAIFYARSTVNDLFGDPEFLHQWLDFIPKATAAENALRDFRTRADPLALLPQPNGVCGDPPPRREKREGTTPGVAGCLGGSSQSGGFRTTDLDGTGAFIPEFAAPLTTRPYADQISQEGSLVPEIARCLTTGEAKRQDWETCTIIAARQPDGGAPAEADPAPETPHSGAAKSQGQDSPDALLAFDLNQITSPGNGSNPKPGAPCHTLPGQANAPVILFPDVVGTLPSGGTPNGHGTAGINSQTAAAGHVIPTAAMNAVRRLTPIECARLQGFPDTYLDITFRKKPAADGLKYRALGNSMAVPIMLYLGKRILAVAAPEPR